MSKNISLLKAFITIKMARTTYSLYDAHGKMVRLCGRQCAAKLPLLQRDNGIRSKEMCKLKGTYGAYSNFTTKLKHSAASLKSKQYKATSVYYHFNGHTYYSLYNTSNQWMGYVDSRGVTLLADQGLYHNFNRHFKITVKNQPIYSSFAWRVTANTTTCLNKTVGQPGLPSPQMGKTTIPFIEMVHGLAM